MNTSSGSLIENEWNHVAATWDGANVALYINGLEEAYVPQTVTPYNHTGPLHIGSRFGTDAPFAGQLDKVRIWNTVLNEPDFFAGLNTDLDGDEPGLVAYYKFDQTDPAITVLPDRSENLNNGTLTNFGGSASWNPSSAFGPQDNALNFDGSNDYVNLGAGNLSIVGDITIEAWINLESYPVADQYAIVSRSAEGETLANNIQYMFRVNQDGYIGMTYEYGAGQNVTAISTQKVPLDCWTHVAVTRLIDGSEADIIFYINGQVVGTHTVANIPAGGTTGTPFIGGNNQSGFEYRFDGSIDEVSIWDRVLNQTEIMDYASYLVGDEPGLQAYYIFDEGNAGGNNGGLTTVPDIGPNNLDGTLNGFALSGSSSNWVASGNYNLIAPTNLFAEDVSETRIDLSWTNNSFASAIIIERSDGDNTNFAQIDIISPFTSGYVDNTVTGGKCILLPRCYYRWRRIHLSVQ